MTYQQGEGHKEEDAPMLEQGGKPDVYNAKDILTKMIEIITLVEMAILD